VTWWKAIGVFAAAIIIGLGFIQLVPFMAQPFALLFVAVSVAAALAPVVKRLSSYIPRQAAVLATGLLLTAVIILLVTAFILPLPAQLEAFIDQIPSYVDTIQDTVNQQLGENQTISSILDQFATEIAQIGRNVISVPVSVVNALFNIVLVWILSLFALAAAPRVKAFYLSLFAQHNRQHAENVGSEVIAVMGAYVHAVLFNMVLVSVMTTVGLMLIGLPYAPLLGVLAGLLEALPTIGSLIAAVPILLVAALQSLPTLGITVVYILIVQQVQGNVISPLVFESQLKVPRFLIPIVIIVGGLMMGVMGALIAVPVVAVLQIIFMREIVPRIRQQTGASADVDLVSEDADDVSEVLPFDEKIQDSQVYTNEDGS